MQRAPADARPRRRPDGDRRPPRAPTRCSRRWWPRPGLRVPGHVDGAELLVRAVLGQQVCVAGARTLARPPGGRSTASPLADPVGGVTPRVPVGRDDRRAERPTISRCRARGAAADRGLRVAGRWRDRPRRRQRSRGDRARAAGGCRASGRGPPATSPCGRSAIPTCSCLPTSGCATPLVALGARRIAGVGRALAERWRPWRSYALHHLWAPCEGDDRWTH